MTAVGSRPSRAFQDAYKDRSSFRSRRILGREPVGGTDDSDAKGLTSNQSGFVCANITLADFGRAIPAMASAYVDRVMVDQRTSKDLLDQGGITVFDALSNAGLKLEGRKLPQPVLVIHHIEKLPDQK